MFGGPVDFRGYFQGYAAAAVQDTKHWFWATPKPHEKSRAGSVRLKSSDPRDVPHVHIEYFESGTTDNDAVFLDMEPLIEGIDFRPNLSPICILIPLFPYSQSWLLYRNRGVLLRIN